MATATKEQTKNSTIKVDKQEKSGMATIALAEDFWTNSPVKEKDVEAYDKYKTEYVKKQIPVAGELLQADKELDDLVLMLEMPFGSTTSITLNKKGEVRDEDSNKVIETPTCDIVTLANKSHYEKETMELLALFV